VDIIYRDENCCLITDKGPRENNEDFGAVEKVGEGYLIIVADGLGGHVGGELASKIAVPSFMDYFKHQFGKKGIEEIMREALKFAHEEILEYKELNPEYGDMGTTLVAAYIKDKVHVVWCGDSRAYLIKDGRIVRRTKDHSPVQRMVDAGEITEEETMRHPMRHIVSNAVGIKLKVDYEEWELGDYLMLSSDGLHDHLTGKEIEEEFYGGACEVAERLIKKALERSGDNVTVAVLKMSVKDEGRVVREAILKAGEKEEVREEEVSPSTPVLGLEVQSPNELPYSSPSLIRLKVSSNSFVENPELDLTYLTYYFDIFWRGEKLTSPKLQLPPLLPGVTLEEKLQLKPKYTGVFPLKFVLKAKESKIAKAIELRVVESLVTPSGEFTGLEKYYDILGLIGEGGFAKVYRARRKRDNLLVALKVPKKVDRHIGRLFFREIEAWKQVNDHPHVVKLLDFNTMPHYIEMELCDYSLSELLDEKGTLSVEETVSIILPILDALEHAHSKGIIHRDIKPVNILFKNDIPKLSDWGIAKVVESSGGFSYLGTPQYKAPEQFFPERFGHTDARTDIWQVGVLMYEMLTGELPFGYDLDEVQGRIRRGIQPKKPSNINPEARRLDGIIMRCLRFKKEKRFQNVSKLKVAITGKVSLETL